MAVLSVAKPATALLTVLIVTSIARIPGKVIYCHFSVELPVGV